MTESVEIRKYSRKGSSQNRRQLHELPRELDQLLFERFRPQKFLSGALRLRLYRRWPICLFWLASLQALVPQ
jgi:hypothetical protein